MSSSIQWLYSSGQNWVYLDSNSQKQIEQLWSYNRASWINSESFKGPIYVDTSLMTLIYNGYAYSLARLRN